MPKRPDSPLTPDVIVVEALALLDEVGLDRMTTRRLAERLGVESPALYWHFSSKQDILEAVGDEIVLRAGMGPPQPEETWQQWISRRASTYRAELLRHRDSARVVAAKRGAGEKVGHLFQDELRHLQALGLDPDLAMKTIATVSHYVTGFVLSEQAAATSPDQQDPGATNIGVPGVDPHGEETFLHGVKVIVQGTASDRSDGSAQRTSQEPNQANKLTPRGT